MSGPISPEGLRRQLAAIKKSRGFLLPHHGLMAATSPELAAGYDATYTALTLAEGNLARRPKEFVWIAILVAAEEAIAVHHIAKLRAAGGGEADFDAAIHLAGFGRSVPSFAFVADAWSSELPHYDRDAAYVHAFEAACKAHAVDPGWAEMAMAAVHTCLFHHWALAIHIRRAYAIGVPEIELAEALALTMFPGSMPYYVEAAGVWRDLILDRAVPASEPFRLWAEEVGPSPRSEKARD